MATIANKAKHKTTRRPIKVGDTDEFGKYGKNDNMAKHKAMREPIKVGLTVLLMLCCVYYLEGHF